MDHYTDFENLEKSEHQYTDFRILWRIGSSGIAIISIHGGEIEQGTTQIADAIAGPEHSFYSFEGMKVAENWALHITSNRFDEPTAMEIVCHSNIIISIHGCMIMEPEVHLGGLDVELKDRIRRELQQSGFQTIISSDPRFRATNQKNICNLCGRGMGVQMEISRGLRAQMFSDLTPEGRFHPTAIFTRFINSVRNALEPFAVNYFENPPLQGTD
jgi:phage replication-related protein YjqB (UPF0714/DUF867 family)